MLDKKRFSKRNDHAGGGRKMAEPHPFPNVAAKQMSALYGIRIFFLVAPPGKTKRSILYPLLLTYHLLKAAQNLYYE
jgi:hypothetical protein